MGILCFCMCSCVHMCVHVCVEGAVHVCCACMCLCATGMFVLCICVHCMNHVSTRMCLCAVNVCMCVAHVCMCVALCLCCAIVCTCMCCARVCLSAHLCVCVCMRVYLSFCPVLMAAACTPRFGACPPFLPLQTQSSVQGPGLNPQSGASSPSGGQELTLTEASWWLRPLPGCPV